MQALMQTKGISQTRLMHSHPGLFHCPIEDAAVGLMPMLHDVIMPLAEERNLKDHVVDARIHMLQKGHWPCIPGWHYDLVPRGADGKQDFTLVDETQKMYLWLSGPPLTLFSKQYVDGKGADQVPVPERTWVEFTQNDRHTGVPSVQNGLWRLFVRIAPPSLMSPAPYDAWIRRHTQVYLEAPERYHW